MLRALSGLFLVGALNRPRKRKKTNRENPRTIPEQIGKIPEKTGKSQKGQKKTKKEGQVQIGKPPRLNPPRLAALESKNGTKVAIAIATISVANVPVASHVVAETGKAAKCRQKVCSSKRPQNWNPEAFDQTKCSRTLSCRICTE